jgi:hypothetical protein
MSPLLLLPLLAVAGCPWQHAFGADVPTSRWDDRVERTLYFWRT